MASDIFTGQNRSTLQSIKDTHNTAANAGVGGYSRRRSGHTQGPVVKNGDGTTTVFNVPHGLVGLDGTAKAPTAWNFEPGNAVSSAARTVTANATNIVITYTAAPASGTGNVVGNYWASLGA